MNLHLTIPDDSPLAGQGAHLVLLDDGSAQLVVGGTVLAVLSSPDRIYLDEAVALLGWPRSTVRDRLKAAGILGRADAKRVGRPPLYYDRAAVLAFRDELARRARQEAERLSGEAP